MASVLVNADGRYRIVIDTTVRGGGTTFLAAARERNRMKSCWYRRNMSPEQRAHYNEMARIRGRRWRLKRKLTDGAVLVTSLLHPKPAKPRTRHAADCMESHGFKVVLLVPDHGAATAHVPRRARFDRQDGRPRRQLGGNVSQATIVW